jgi:hypothetical protein
MADAQCTLSLPNKKLTTRNDDQPLIQIREMKLPSGYEHSRDFRKKGRHMRLNEKIKSTAATGYILLWLLGIPILLLIFLLRGCT